MDYVIRKFEPEDQNPIIDIFNHFIENSFAAYPEKRVEYDFFENFRKMTKGYPFYVIESPENKLIGFGFLHPYHGYKVFNRVAEITYFILPEHTRKGLGETLLDILINETKSLKIDTLLANISSLNETSLNFHVKNGFAKCGQFKSIGKKFNQDFDVVWMQKFI